MTKLRQTTADEVRRDIESQPELNSAGVDFEAVAREMNDETRLVPGWEAPRILPAQWIEMDRDDAGGARYFCRAMSLLALLSCAIELDGRAWLHLSVSHQQRIPRWTEMAEVKRVFLGDREAYQVMPAPSRYVNINARVLHMFALLDDKAVALPDFTRGTGSL